MNKNKLNIESLFNKTSTVPFQSGHEALAFKPLFDGIKNLPAGLPAIFLNENSAFTLSFTAKHGNLFIISEARLFIGSAFEVDNVTVKLFNKGIEVEAITIADLLEGSGTTSIPNNYNFTNTQNLVDRVDIICNSGFANTTQTILTEFELYGRNITSDFEFNDSVLTTKAWNSSRYDGRQLSGLKLNKFTSGDSSYGLTPVISNLTRTFYISSDITSLGNTGLRINRLSGAEEEDTENPIEDPSLQYIPDFSYIVVNKSITINKDNSIKITDLSTFNASPDGTNRRTGFNREFQTNIPDGSYIGLKNLDASVKDRSDISYRVYFNAGRLQPIARYINDFSKQDIAGSTTLLKTLKFAVIDPFNQGGSFTIQNRKKVRRFFTGSIQPKTVNGTAVGPSYNEFKSFFGAMSAYRNTNVSKPRFFFSLLNTLGETAPANPLAKDIEVIRTVSSESGFFPTENLAELSTAEITSNGESFSNFILGGSSTFNLNQNYTTEVTTNEVTDPDTGGTITIIAGGSSPLLFSGSYDISFLNENKPSLLVNLNKEIEFPDGIGRTPLVIIPETLHPYIKDNIPQFMAQAGFDIGNITQINALDETNRTLS